MPELCGDYKDISFTDQEKQWADYAKNEYLKQISGNESVKEKVMAIYEVIDNINAKSFEPLKDQPSCKKGCAHCCYIQVATMEWEVDTLLEYMKHRGLEFEESDIQRLEEQAKLDNFEYILSPHRKCVFLDDNNMCSIYEARPSACRNYFVFNDPSECDTFNTNISGRTLVNFNLNTIPPILALMEKSEMKPLAVHLLNKIKNIKDDNNKTIC